MVGNELPDMIATVIGSWSELPLRGTPEPTKEWINPPTYAGRKSLGQGKARRIAHLMRYYLRHFLYMSAISRIWNQRPFFLLLVRSFVMDSTPGKKLRFVLTTAA